MEDVSKNEKVNIIKTIPVPLSLKEIKENLVINTNTGSKSSKEELINQAFKLHSQGNIAEAESCYQHLINKGFEDHRIFSNYGSILKSLGKSKDALHYTRKAIDLKPDFAKLHLNLGNILRDLGNLKEAELSTRKAIELKPDFINAHINLGTILIDLGNLKEAELSIRKAIKLEPFSAKAYYNLATILVDLHNLKEAELYIRKSIALDPNLFNSHFLLGTILIGQKKLKEAELSIRKVIELKPDFIMAHIYLGNTYYNLQNYKQASDSFRNALSLNSDMDDIRYSLAVALENEAKSEYLKAFKKTDVIAKLGPTNRRLKTYQKKEIIIKKDTIVLLNKLSKSINELYGLTPSGEQAINSGPCGVFANEFFILWNSRFINQVEIGFKMDICPYQCSHVFIKLPNNQLFDGGNGVYEFNTYEGKETELIFMEKYDLELLDKYSWGLIRSYAKCPNFSASKTSEVIAKHLDEIYYALC